MRGEYDFSKGVRGKHAGVEIRVVGAKAAGSRPAKIEASKTKTTQAPKDRENFDEAVRLLMRVRPHLQDSQRAQKIKEQIQAFLDRTVA